MGVFKFVKKVQDINKNPKKPMIEDSKEVGVSVIALIKEFIAGDVFFRETVRKQYLLVLLLFVLSLAYINNKFLYEKELRRVERLRNEVVDLKYKSLTLSKELKLAGRRTMVIEALDDMGVDLFEASEPIIVIED